MRIGFITGEYPPMTGGVGAYTQILAQTLAEQGHNIFIYSDHRAHEPNANIHLTATAKNWRFAQTRHLRQWITNNRLNVVNLQYQTAAYQMSPIIHILPDALGSHAPFVTTFHDLRVPYLFPKAGRLREQFVTHLARKSHAVIATNDEDYARLKSHPKHALIPIGSNIIVSPNPEANARTKLNAADDAFVLAFFGFVNRSKGLETLLESLAALRNQGIPARLLMIGEKLGSSDPTNAAYAAEIDALIQRLQIADAILWTGHVDDHTAAGYLTTADVIVLPFTDGASYRRGTLMAAIEYGCAIVTTTPRVAIPAFRQGKNMLCVQPEHTQALTETLQRLYNNPSQMATLKRGTSKLRGLFQWDAIAREHITLFNRLV